MKFKNLHTIVEQIALLMASFVWTTIVLLAVVLFWAYQDVQSRWDAIVNPPPPPMAQAAETPTPTATLWAGPGATLTPTPTLPPTALPTRVIEMPDMLPETLNPGEPTPMPVVTPALTTEQMAGLPGSPANVSFNPPPNPNPRNAPPPPGLSTMNSGGDGRPPRLVIDSMAWMPR
jgi:enamine deaminase RidA (YjgF/YER057c/UK114 family)